MRDPEVVKTDENDKLNRTEQNSSSPFLVVKEEVRTMPSQSREPEGSGFFLGLSGNLENSCAVITIVLRKNAHVLSG